ncbi:histidine kinase [Shewanella sp. VB17]|uniref:sensor histidine kinase n=1 Tax=Shewanella sp. VB17 TaxID=2739432 RepID=UPI0015651B3F|nr:ATP-binding protein [Shewanella sp. VB17]NRD71839.1 histidine kinase [Shewanella sp. VB17]
MADKDPYKTAYERERFARKQAETLLDEKSRSLYDSVVKLQSTVDALEETQEQLVQSEKMASIGLLAAGVAHEINNPIGFSLSNLTTLSEYVESFIKLDKLVVSNLPALESHPLANQYQALRKEEDISFIVDDLKELLGDTINGLNRVSSIVINLKKVTHSGELEMELHDVNHIIKESIKVVWSELKYNMEVQKQLTDVPMVLCHMGEIHQVLMNLFLNASHACEDKGILSLKTSTRKEKNQQWIVIEVNDNGKGMSREVIKKIFDPFFTTKPIGVGTGLGLSVSFGIIEKHGGKIKVTSVEGEGTTFIIHLPLPESDQ